MENKKGTMSFLEALEEYKKRVKISTYTVHTYRGDSRKVKGWNIAYVRYEKDTGRKENKFIYMTEKGKFLLETEILSDLSGEENRYYLEYLTEFGTDTIEEDLRLSIEKEFLEQLPDIEISDMIPELSDDEVDHDE